MSRQTTSVNRFVSVVALTFAVSAGAAAAQSSTTPIPQPASPQPASPQPASLPPAGIIPPSLSLTVTGAPVAASDVLDTQIRAALERRIRPTLRPGAAVNYGPIVPWPLSPLAAGFSTVVDVTVTIEGDDASAAATGVTTVTVNNVPLAAAPPRVLFLSDDPEYLESDGLVFRGTVTAAQPARLYYYHSDIGVPRDVDVVLTADLPSHVQLIDSASGPDLDVMSVGHAVSRDLLRFEGADEGTIVDIEPGKPFVVRHALMIPGELAAGAIDVHVVSGGSVTVSVVAASGGRSPESYLPGPRLPFDGRSRHGMFDLDGFGSIAQTYTVGGPDVAVKYGGRKQTPQNLDPADPGHDYGDYGIIDRITFALINPTDTPQLVYLYEKPLGGPVTSTFLVDGRLKELGCVRMPQPYWVATYQLPANSKSSSTTVTMTDGGSFYPLEFGVTTTQPLPYTPPVGTPDGCSPIATRSSAPPSAAVKQ